MEDLHPIKNAHDAVRSAYAAWKQATKDCDVVLLDQLYTPDFVYMKSNGIPSSKIEELRNVRHQCVDYLQWKDDNFEINIENNSATVRTGQAIAMMVYELPVRLQREVVIKLEKNVAGWQISQIIETKIN